MLGKLAHRFVGYSAHSSVPTDTFSRPTWPSGLLQGEINLNDHSTAPPPYLPCPGQQTRYSMAADDLVAARRLDLGSIPRPQLIIQFERLLGSLDDALQLIREMSPEVADGQGE